MNAIVMLNHLSNSQAAWDGVVEDVKKYARQAGVGSNSREHFLIRCVRGGARDGLSSEASKDKTRPDHARQLYMIYEATRKENNDLEQDAPAHKDSTITSKSSNFRTAILFGQTRDEDAIEMINRAWTLIPKIPAKDRRQPFECLNRVITEALKDHNATRSLTNEEMMAVMMKNEDAEKKPKTAADYLREARKRAEQAEKLQANAAVSRVIESIDEALRWLPSA